MKKKLLQIVFLALPFFTNAQEFVDLFSINYSKSEKTNFDDSTINTTITTSATNLILPVVLNEKYTALGGVNYIFYNLQILPNAGNTSLHTTALRAGLKVNHSEHWSGIYVLIPKIASDYKQISGEDFYFGGVAIAKYRRDKNFTYSIGLYASTEAYGISTTPVLGLYYHSPNQRFEVNCLMPNDADMNYLISEKTKIGVDFLGHGNSYKITTDNVQSNYVENNSIDFSSYVQQSVLDKKVLLRLKAGYSLNDFRVYPIDQKLDLQILALRFGDNRTRILQDKSNSLFLKLEAIYRFDLSKFQK